MAATGGTPLHGLVTEHQVRPLFGFFNALTLPTAIYATETDFANYKIISPVVDDRIARAVSELVQVLPASDQNTAVSALGNRPALTVASAWPLKEGECNVLCQPRAG